MYKHLIEEKKTEGIHVQRCAIFIAYYVWVSDRAIFTQFFYGVFHDHWISNTEL